MARASLAGLAALCVALRDRELAPSLYESIASRDDLWTIGGGGTLAPWVLWLGSLPRLSGRTNDVLTTAPDPPRSDGAASLPAKGRRRHVAGEPGGNRDALPPRARGHRRLPLRPAAGRMARSRPVQRDG